MTADFVFAYLTDPVRRRNDLGRTRMPDFSLHEAERVALALYLGTDAVVGSDFSSAVTRNPGADSEAGARVFRSLGCAGCHEHPEASPDTVGPDLSGEGARVKSEWLERYLAAPRAVRGDGHPASPGARMPDFALDTQEVEALQALLEDGGTPGTWIPDVLTPFQVLRTERLLEGRLACKGCHTISGEGGQIGPPLEGIADRLQPSFVLDIISDPGRVVTGAGMPGQHLRPRDARRVASYLIQLSGTTRPAEYSSLLGASHPSRALSDDLAPGAARYAKHCASCHGPLGRGDGFNAPYLPVPPTAHSNAALMTRRPDDTLFDGISAGAFVLDGSPRMPAFASLFTSEEIRELVVHIRSLCACEGPAWSRGPGAP